MHGAWLLVWGCNLGRRWGDSFVKELNRWLYTLDTDLVVDDVVCTVCIE